MVKAILTKPLDGNPEGTVRDFSKADFERLHARGAVRKAPAEAKTAVKPLNKKAPTVDNKAAL